MFIPSCYLRFPALSVTLAQTYLNLLDKVPFISLMGSNYKLMELDNEIIDNISTIDEFEIAFKELKNKNIIKHFRLIKEPLRSYLLVEFAQPSTGGT